MQTAYGHGPLRCHLKGLQSVGDGNRSGRLSKSTDECRVAAKFVPCFMTEDQKQYRIEVCKGLLKGAINDNTFLKSINR